MLSTIGRKQIRQLIKPTGKFPEYSSFAKNFSIYFTNSTEVIKNLNDFKQKLNAFLTKYPNISKYLINDELTLENVNIFLNNLEKIISSSELSKEERQSIYEYMQKLYLEFNNKLKTTTYYKYDQRTQKLTSNIDFKGTSKLFSSPILINTYIAIIAKMVIKLNNIIYSDEVLKDTIDITEKFAKEIEMHELFTEYMDKMQTSNNKSTKFKKEFSDSDIKKAIEHFENPDKVNLNLVKGRLNTAFNENNFHKTIEDFINKLHNESAGLFNTAVIVYRFKENSYYLYRNQIEVSNINVRYIGQKNNSKLESKVRNVLSETKFSSNISSSLSLVQVQNGGEPLSLTAAAFIILFMIAAIILTCSILAIKVNNNNRLWQLLIKKLLILPYLVLKLLLLILIKIISIISDNLHKSGKSNKKNNGNKGNKGKKNNNSNEGKKNNNSNKGKKGNNKGNFGLSSFQLNE